MKIWPWNKRLIDYIERKYITIRLFGVFCLVTICMFFVCYRLALKLERGDKNKRKKVLTWLNPKPNEVIFVQETHLTAEFYKHFCPQIKPIMYKAYIIESIECGFLSPSQRIGVLIIKFLFKLRLKLICSMIIFGREDELVMLIFLCNMFNSCTFVT